MTWRHTNAFSNGDCREWLPDISPYREACNCTTPTPDPTSPCAVCKAPKYEWHLRSIDREATESHPHVPTRCTCGHQLEAVNAR